MLSGAAASCMKEDENAQLRTLYLRAVAQQLPASEIAVGMESVASVAAGNNNMEFEMIRAQRLYEVLDVSSRKDDDENFCVCQTWNLSNFSLRFNSLMD